MLNRDGLESDLQHMESSEHQTSPGKGLPHISVLHLDVSDGNVRG
jgi:hypothetical protein